MQPYIIFTLSWLVPGLGHFLQKRRIKAICFFFGILALLLLGILMQGRFYGLKPFHPLLVLGFIGDLGNGIFFILFQLMGWAGGDLKSATFHYGTTYLSVAGLLNYLIALNAFDIAKGRRK